MCACVHTCVHVYTRAHACIRVWVCTCISLPAYMSTRPHRCALNSMRVFVSVTLSFPSTVHGYRRAVLAKHAAVADKNNKMLGKWDACKSAKHAHCDACHWACFFSTGVFASTYMHIANYLCSELGVTGLKESPP